MNYLRILHIFLDEKIKSNVTFVLQKDFPTTILLPGEIYHNKISYEFGIVDKSAYGPVKTIEICEKVKVQPDCCNKIEGDTVDFTCDKDLYSREKDEQYNPPPPIKPKDRCC